jgi:hypothetical protein
MKQYKITASNILKADTDDCVLSPDDPIHLLKSTSMLGGIGSDAALAEYNLINTPKVAGSTLGQEAREQNIKPGTDEWFKHWFKR